MRYGTGSSYTDKFYSILHFFMPEEKVITPVSQLLGEDSREKGVKN